MSSAKRRWSAVAAVAAVGMGMLGSSATALAQPGTEAEPQPAPDAAPAEVLHNVIYRARADGTSRDAVVAYKMDDANVNSATPTMLPGQTFEVNAVLADPKLAGMEVSIGWPYGSNLHCEILVDDQIVAQADQFIAPRFFRVKDDPMYGTLQCGAPLDIPNVAAPDLTPHPPTRTSSAAGRATPACRLIARGANPWCPPIPRPAGRRRETTAPSRRRRRRVGVRLGRDPPLQREVVGLHRRVGTSASRTNSRANCCPGQPSTLIWTFVGRPGSAEQ